MTFEEEYGYSREESLARAARETAQANKLKAETIVQLVAEGFTPKSASAYADTGKTEDLRHTGMVSVRLYKPAMDTGTMAGPSKIVPEGFEMAVGCAECKLVISENSIENHVCSAAQKKREMEDLVVKAIQSAKLKGRL